MSVAIIFVSAHPTVALVRFGALGEVAEQVVTRVRIEIPRILTNITE